MRVVKIDLQLRYELEVMSIADCFTAFLFCFLQALRVSAQWSRRELLMTEVTSFRQTWSPCFQVWRANLLAFLLHLPAVTFSEVAPIYDSSPETTLHIRRYILEISLFSLNCGIGRSQSVHDCKSDLERKDHPQCHK